MNRKPRRPTRHRSLSGFRLESLEGKALPATFVAPNLNPLIHAALHGANTAPQGIHTMLQSLQNQLTAGPLADLKDGTATPEEFLADSQELIDSFKASVDQTLLPSFPNVARILRNQGTGVLKGLQAANAQLDAALIDDAGFESAAMTAINAPLAGPLRPLHTPLSGYVARTRAFQDQLQTLDDSLADGADPELAIEKVNTVLKAEAASYQADLNAALNGHPWILNQATTSLNRLLADVQAIEDNPPANVRAAFSAAITTFDTAILDTTGLFGPRGPIARHK
jgi:hypothetical protein